MYCKQCGTIISDDTSVCPGCGAATEQTAVAKADSSTAVPAVTASPVPVLVWGIVGLTLSIIFYVSFLGIIFSAIASKKAKEYFASYGNASNMARIGKGLSKAGIIVGIINTVLLVLFIAFMLFVAYVSVN